MAKNKEKKYLVPTLVFAIFAIGLLLLGIYYHIKKPEIQYVGSVEFNNNTIFLYKVNIKGTDYLYLCPTRLPEGKKCIVTPNNLVCEFTTPCVRVITIIE